MLLGHTYTSTLRKNQIRNVFLNPQERKVLLGKAKLKEFVKEGIPFILDDHEGGVPIPLSKQPVYSTQEWMVEFTELTDIGKRWVWDPSNYRAKFRYLKATGITGSKLYEESEPTYPSRDKFLIVDGREIF